MSNPIIDNNGCNSNPCENGGTCIDEVDGYSCDCVTGYEDDNCETSKLCNSDFRCGYRTGKEL